MGGRPECPKKNLSEQGENQPQTQPTNDAGSGNRTRATLVGEGGGGGRKTGVPREKPLAARREPTTKVNPHMTPGPGIEPRPHWWEASAHTTSPSLKEDASNRGSVVYYHFPCCPVSLFPEHFPTCCLCLFCSVPRDYPSRWTKPGAEVSSK